LLIDGPIVTRFAPAPTGPLHLGHVVNAIYVWGVARRMGGCVRLRIEDHDRMRCRPELEAGILDDLDWLGFMPDAPSTDAFREGRCEGRQSDRDAINQAAIDRLRQHGLVYACRCSRAEIAAAGGDGDAELRYPGTCASLGLPETPGLGLRVRLLDDEERFDDLMAGPQAQRPSTQCGDLLVKDRFGQWTYQFAAAVDDWVDGITLVIRGVDLLASTGRQMQLARLLGRAEPARFLHHPLVMKTPDQKLSKSDGATGIRELRDAGRSAAEVIGAAAARIGLLDAARPVAATDVGTLVQEIPR
jgi:glutamyl-tRNA synthetase/glutamyl-Q tRNA(Asp) synthetase